MLKKIKLSDINSTVRLFDPLLEKMGFFIVSCVPMFVAYIIWILYAFINFEIEKKIFIFWFVIFFSVITIIFVWCFSSGIYCSITRWLFFNKFNNDITYRDEWKKLFMDSPHVLLWNLIFAKQNNLLDDVEFETKKRQFIEWKYIDKYDFVLLKQIQEELRINDEEFQIKKHAFLTNKDILASKNFLNELVRSNLLTSEEACVKYDDIIKKLIRILIAFFSVVAAGIVFMYLL